MQSKTTTLPSSRIVSIDLLRGLVMIIMALDHVRDFFHGSAYVYDPLDFSQTSVPIFLTRWITHFCAAVFVFLSGTSAYLTLAQKGRKKLSRFLFTRGLWLIVVEITVINFGWFLTQMSSFIMLQVIWAIGVSMVVLSVLIYLPKRVLLVIALAIIIGHNTLDPIRFTGISSTAVLWSVFHQQNFFAFGNFRLLIAYPIFPWLGVMTAGYCFGEIFVRYSADERKKKLAVIGLSAIIVFIALRLSNIYGDPNPWSHQKNTVFTMLSFINTTKYPPSLLFTLMTLGPAILLLACTEKPLNRLTKIFAVYGRVPMMYYLLHLYLIHTAFIVIALIKGFSLQAAYNGGVMNPLPGFGFRLVTVYVIWITIVALLYPLCSTYDKYKMANKKKWWLSYL